MSNVTRLLTQIEQGEAGAAEQLLPLVYQELRSLAAARLAQENPGQTRQATALVHEAFLRLVGSDRRAEPGSANGDTTGQSGPAVVVGTYNSRGRFFAAAAEAMRRILVDRARQKAAAKRGGGLARVDLDPDLAAAPEVHEDLLALDAALDQLAAEYPQQAEGRGQGRRRGPRGRKANRPRRAARGASSR
jgi:DNA-directed RNA polymerase specialized sigma24 family protein